MHLKKILKLHNYIPKKVILKYEYLNKSPEKLKEFEKFDVILNLEIVEHVDDLKLYIKSCNKLLKKME